METTERTFLMKPSPSYVEIRGLHRSKKIRIHKLRCCLSAAFLALTIMVLIAITSILTKTPEPVSEPNNDTQSENTFQLSFDADANFSFALDELESAIEKGNDAIRDRFIADANAQVLLSPSPSARHQYALSTGPRAKNLSLAAVGELAATKKIEDGRKKLGMPSAMGRHFDVGWVPKDGCKVLDNISCVVSKYRTIDGTCNHRYHLGSAFTPLTRLLAPAYADGIEAPRVGKRGNLPSAKEVSLNAHKPEYSVNPTFTVMVAAFGQFLDHDITATALSQGLNGKPLACCMSSLPMHPECFPVEMDVDDPNVKGSQKLCMEFVRSAPAPQCKLGHREQLNQVTAFIDGSMIYGSDNETATSLRCGVGGELHMVKTNFNTTLLPPSKDLNDGCNREQEARRGRYCFESGDKRANENLHLTAMHVIWARQHNLVALELRKLNPTWDDETLYQEARRIVGAQLQHITYNELLPVILGDNVTEARDLKPLKVGFRQRESRDADPSIINAFASSAFRFAHTLIPGLMRVARTDNSSDNYVILHRILFNPYQFYSANNIDNTLKSVLITPIQKTTPHLSAELSQHLFEDSIGPDNEQPRIAVNKGLDLVSLNIQRGRDHGLPSYPRWREFCTKDKIRTFRDLKNFVDDESVKEIGRIYNDVEDIDLYTGALAEKPVPNGLVGPTFSCIIAEQFERIMKGDRYWYEYEGEDGSFTNEQLEELKKTTLARVICDCSDNIGELQQKVMLTASKTNPIVSCDEFPKLDLTHWRER